LLTQARHHTTRYERITKRLHHRTDDASHYSCETYPSIHSLKLRSKNLTQTGNLLRLGARYAQRTADGDRCIGDAAPFATILTFHRATVELGLFWDLWMSGGRGVAGMQSSARGVMVGNSTRQAVGLRMGVGVCASICGLIPVGRCTCGMPSCGRGGKSGGLEAKYIHGWALRQA